MFFHWSLCLPGGDCISKGVSEPTCAEGRQASVANNPGQEIVTRKAKIGLISLGCSKNLVDSEILLGTLQKEGHAVSTDIDDADVVIVNTCTFIREATEESVGAILEAIELKKAGRIRAVVVAGCLPQRYWRHNLAAELREVDAFVGVGHHHRIGEIVETVLGGHRAHAVNRCPGFTAGGTAPRYSLTPDHYAYVKISEGCDNRCTYCIIPEVRGPHRSRRMKSIVEEVQRLSDERPLAEIILVGQDTTLYGTDIYGRPRLADLLRKVASLKRVKWIRLLYTHPAHFDDEVIDIIRDEPSLCAYVDLPLQHIDDTILLNMGRKVSRREVEKLIERLREQIPALTLRTTFIVGFPGETESQFEDLLRFVRNVQFERLGAFAYSREENTAAYSFPGHIPEEIGRKRLRRLMRTQRDISRKRNRSLIGSEQEVLVDGPTIDDPTLFLARTGGDAPDVDQLVYVQSRTARPGDFLKARITDAYEYDLVAVPLSFKGSGARPSNGASA